MSYPIPANENERTASLKSLQILDTDCAPDFDTIVEMASQLFGVPMSLISLVDKDRQWFKAAKGLAMLESTRDASFCAHTICSDEPFVISDALADRRFKDNVLVKGEPRIRFYAGLPLSLCDGLNIGSFCILDVKPRTMTDEDLIRLRHLRDLAGSLLRSHARSIQIKEQADIIQQQKETLRKKSQLLESACQIGKIGAWERSLETGELTLTDGIYKLLEMRPGRKMDLDKILELYPEPDRSRLKMVMENADAEGKPYSFIGRMHTQKGKLKWVKLTSEVEIQDNRAIRRFGLTQDITSEKTLLDRIEHLANADELTGAGNRRFLRNHLASLGRLDAGRGVAALITFDLDGFKEVNDAHGHAAGDACLRQIADNVTRALGNSGVVARTGGDEFACVWTSPDNRTLQEVIEAISKAVSCPIKWRRQSFQLSCSLGVTTRLLGQRFSADEALREADLALYDAKREGKNCWRYFRDEFENAANERIDVIKSVKSALSRGQFQLYFQPKVILPTRAHTGFEALLRLVADDGTVLGPQSFLAAFEDHTLSKEIGAFVVEAALKKAHDWAQRRVPFGNIAINLSASQLTDPDFARGLIGRMRDLELPSRAISVEVTEGVFLSTKSDVITANCRQLSEAGISIAFDDFGTGYASLTHLRDFPVDIIKIDRSFIAALNDRARATGIVNAIVGLGNNLNLGVVAEGVETEAQCEFLAAIGCGFGQGFLFGKPICADEAEKTLVSSANAPTQKVA